MKPPTSTNGANNVVNTAALRELYRKSDVGKELFDHFASRTNDSRETKLDRARAVLVARGARASIADLREFFRQLEHLGCGRYVIGRRGHPSRFIWTAGLVSVGQVASGKGVDVEEVRSPSELEEGPSRDTLDHIFQLRPSMTVALSLPANLTATEAARLADFIRTLPFEPVSQSAGPLVS